MWAEELVGRLAGRFYGELPLPPPPLQHHHPTSTVQTKLQFLASLLHTIHTSIHQHNDIGMLQLLFSKIPSSVKF